MARTRDEAARRRVLNSARELVSERGPRAVTVDDIAAAAGVGKQTLYRWWPSKSSVIMDALIELTDPDPADLPESTCEALRLQMRRVAGMFASRNGELIRELVADSQGNPALANDFRDRFFAHRRARGAATLEKGIVTGELRPDLDVEDALDVLYGPLWLRLLVGHRPVTQGGADELFELVWPGLKHEPVTPAAKEGPAHQRSNDPAADPRVTMTEHPTIPTLDEKPAKTVSTDSVRRDRRVT